MGSLFKTEQKTKSSGTQQGTTESNYWDQPGLQEFLSGYNQQYSGPNISQVQAPVNAWQTGAATNQAGLATGLGGAFNSANSVATNGIDPNSISRFMSPYIQSVVNPTLDAQRIQNEQAVSSIRGNSATRGALGNNTGQTAAYYAGVQPGQQAQIAGLYNQGFNQAGQLATQDVMSRLQGAGAVGNLTGVGTQANQGQFNMGETMRNAEMQNQMTPFALFNQGLQGQLGFGNLAGQNTSGSSTGNQTTTSTPGLGQSLAGIAGMGMSLFGGGGMFPGLFSGFGNSGGGSYTGGGSSSWRDGGAVKGYNDGGSVLPSFHGGSESFADKVARAHETVSKLRASGGRTEKKEEPRTGQFSPRFDLLNRWAPTVTEERGQDPFMNPEQAQRMMAFQPMRPMQYELSELRGFDEGGSVLPEAFQPFQGFNASNTTPMGPAFGGNPFAQFMPSGADAPVLGPETTGQMLPFGGDPLTSQNVIEAYNPSGPPRIPPFNPDAPPPSAGPVMDPDATPSDGGRGRRQIEQMHPHQRMAAMLMAASGPGVLGPGGRALIDMHQQRIAEHGAELQADQLAQQLAHQNATLGINRDELSERARHNRRMEELKGVSRPETAFDTASAQAAAKAAQERETAIAASQDEVRRLDQMSALLSNPNMPQGRFADWEVEGRRVAAALFPNVNMEGVPEAEAFRTLSNKMALSMRSTANGEGMPGAMSDADRTFLLQSVPRLQNTPAGNRLIVNSMRDTAQYRAAANTEAARYIHERRSNQGLSEHMARWMQQNPMARVVPGHAETRREAERVAEQNAPPPPNQAQTPTFSGYTREQLAAMPEGPVMTPQGQPTGLIRRGNELIPVQGEAGTQGNPHPRLADATQPGQYAYDKGKLYRRTKNMLTNRWEEVTQ